MHRNQQIESEEIEDKKKKKRNEAKKKYNMLNKTDLLARCSHISKIGFWRNIKDYLS